MPLRSHQGRGPLITPLPPAAQTQTPAGLERVLDFPHITDSMQARSCSDGRIRRVLGLNWLRLLGDVWH